jgi:zinc and cadmium transporter
VLFTWFLTIASVLVVSLVSLIGILMIPMGREKLNQTIFLLVSLAVGAMFGDTFIHLLPESFEKGGAKIDVSLNVLAGIFVFFILEKFLHWRHEHVLQQKNQLHPVGYVNIVADALHNLVDGILIGASYLVDVRVGLATTVAVLLHEIPQEMGDFGVLVYAGFSKAKALSLNFLSASLAIVGAVFSLVAGAFSEQFTSFMIPFTAGGFIYIAGSDLVPELHKEVELSRSMLQLVGIGTGVGLMFLLALLG